MRWTSPKIYSANNHKGDYETYGNDYEAFLTQYHGTEYTTYALSVIIGTTMISKKAFFCLATFVLLLTVLPLLSPSYAAKPRVRTGKTSAGSGIAYSSVRLSRPSNSIIVTFLNLNKVRKVNYILSYAANGKEEGAGGAISPTGQASDSRDLYFGTCSHGVCTPHYNIKNAVLVVTTTLSSGGTYTKRYRIKV